MRNTDALRALLPPGCRVLCAVSGGSDSMCLLHLLWTRREDLAIEVFAAHFEHGLRGEDALRDAAFVEDHCRQSGIPCTVEHADVHGYAEKEGLGIEEAARKLRYDFLERTADRLGCDRIATAHNADDNAETLLLNLIRGSGLKGLGGIPPQRGRIVRPLLNVSREEIRAYLEEHSVPHVEDASNADERFRRNLVRMRLMPVLRELNPAFVHGAGRTARLLRRDEDCLAAIAADFIDRHFDGESFPVEDLLTLHPAVSSRVVRALCEKGLSSDQVEDVLSFCRGDGLGFLDLPGQRLRREQGRLFFEAGAPLSIQERRIGPGETLEIPEAGLRVRAEMIEYNQKVNSLFKTYCLKYENIRGNTIRVTGRQPGDRMRPANRGCSKSLRVLFREAGMTQRERDQCLVFRDEAGILAVHGLAVDERALPAPGDTVLRLTVEKREDDT